jgi:4-hydroxy-2-oxoheptanedioate aldolase
MSMNRLRDLYAERRPAVGTFFSAGNPSMMECLGYTGLDFAVIDTEHGPFDTMDMQDLIRAAESVGLVPIVRIADVTHKEIQRAADCGAQGIIIPCLRSIEGFKKAVDLAKYTPIGSRGFIKGRGAGFGYAPWTEGPLESYYAKSNEKFMLIPQCETIEALEQIEDIAAIEGVDGIFVGPYDLSTCMGIPGQFGDPRLIEARRRVLRACQAADKPCYILSMNPAEAASLLKEGYAGVAHSLDFIIFTEAYKKEVAAIRDGLK